LPVDISIADGFTTTGEDFLTMLIVQCIFFFCLFFVWAAGCLYSLVDLASRYTTEASNRRGQYIETKTR
jgi:hypothetical protein